ncbi:MAG: hypothetical protein KBT75_02565 [Oleispira antarctica]|uniref:Transposase n=1 Tax=Oleispira antarctica RB-8 TaxID=698738 RepID=R4YSE8_OLEAN|nr:hypothetical protein [Oleispira antarctica]MBQ0791225.1 hypothetical protein [Oleispira antarctica]CCK78007.1 hypothetical protein OLEAN_C38310 [Oleispira antarctica RB-8]
MMQSLGRQYVRYFNAVHQRTGALWEAKLITPHNEYLKLDKNSEKRQQVYRILFQGLMPELDLNEIRYALQKEWVLGDDRLKRRIEEKIGICRDKHGGDRKSLVF